MKTKRTFTDRLQDAITEARKQATSAAPMYVRIDGTRLVVTDRRPHRRAGYFLVEPNRCTLCTAIN